MKTKLVQIAVHLAFILCLLAPGMAGATGYTLTLVAQGSGTVTQNPTNSLHPAGSTVTLTASNNPGWYFSGWTGDTNSLANPLNVTLNSNMVITGNFLAYPTYSLTVVTNGQGAIDLNPPGGSYLSNSVVTATAAPATGWVFVAWSGVTNTSVNPVSLTLDTNVLLTGTFAQLPAFDAQPSSVTNKIGGTVSFSAHAVGTRPLGYQWYFSGGSLSNTATNTTLSLTNISSGNAGAYLLVATNSYGNATSQIATLTLTNQVGPTNMVNSPDEASLRAAIALGGWIGLGFNGTVTVTNTINITNNVILDGNNVAATISGGNAVRIFYVASGASLMASNVTLANGSFVITNSSMGTNADGGAIYNDGGDVTLVGCTLTNNVAQSLIYAGVARGGAIFNNAGTVFLSDSVITNNSVVGGGPNSYLDPAPPGTALGGAVYTTAGLLTVTGCSLGGNSCTSVCEGGPLLGGPGGLTMGGAVFQSSGSFAIGNSGFISNQTVGGSGLSLGKASPAYGGAVAVTGGSLSIDQSQFWDNQALGGAAGYHGTAGSSYGGAIYSAVTLTVRDSSFSGNQSSAGGHTAVPQGGSKGVDGFGGAIYNQGTTLLNRCSIYSNYVQGGSTSAYMGSSATGGSALGGGVCNASQIAITNCTIALNSAVGGDGSSYLGPLGYGGITLGGGLFNLASATLIAMNVTIVSNTCYSPSIGGVSANSDTNGLAAGLQIANATNGTLRLHNSIIACSVTNSNAYGPITDDGYNISDDGSANFASGSSYNFTDPQLAPLGNYGGPTLCMALMPTSPASDFGDTAGCPNTDQRGYIRPFGAGPDIGAYEYGSVQAVVPVLNIAANATNVVIFFTASPSKTYYLQGSTNLSTWTDLNTNGPFASSTNINQTISKQGFKTRYFRLLMP